METVVLVLMALVAVLTGLKLTFLKVWQRAVILIVFALFTGCCWPWAILQSRNQIAEWLGNQQLMLDTSVLITLEVIVQMAFCLLAGRLLYGGAVGKRTLWIYRVLRFFPGILIFPVLFYTLVQVIYTFPGQDFALLAGGSAVAVLLVFGLVSWGLKFLLPEKPLRLELMFLCAALVLILGIVATVNGTTSFKGSDAIEWAALGAFIGLMCVCGVIGYLIFQFKNKKI